MAKHQTELEKLQEDLATARAEIEALKAKSGGKVKSLKTSGIPESEMADTATALGQVQRKDRASQIDAFPKIARMLPVGRVCELIVALAQEAASTAGKDFDAVLAAVTTRTEKTKKEAAPAVVEDQTLVNA
jgi:hypothetical protein